MFVGLTRGYKSNAATLDTYAYHADLKSSSYWTGGQAKERSLKQTWMYDSWRAKKERMAMSEERVPTGITGLDERINGGLPKGSLTVVGGEPGSGKTTLCAQFLHYGATEHEPSVYVSFGENHKVFYSNMRLFGLDFEKCDQSFKYLDFMRMKSGSESVLAILLQELEQFKTRRLAIDSFTALSQTIRDVPEQLVVMDTILSKILRGMGCTTIVTVEKRVGQPLLGSGFEEFVADGILMLERDTKSGIRQVRIPKMRSTALPQDRFPYTLYHGFHLIPPLSRSRRVVSLLVSDPKIADKPGHIEKKSSLKKQWTPIQDTSTRFSTGNKSLDEIIGGGFERGSYAVLEVGRNVPPRGVKLFTYPLTWNFMSQGRGVVFYLGPSSSSEEIREIAGSYINLRTFDRLGRVLEEKPSGRRLPKRPFTVMLKEGNADLDDDAQVFSSVTRALMKQTGKNVLSIINLAELENKYAGNLDKLFTHIGRWIGENMNLGNVTLAVAKPGLGITSKLLNITRWHLRLIERDGSTFLYSIMPRRVTPHAMDIDESQEQLSMQLTPML